MIRKLFHLFPGEERDALWFGLLGLVWALAATAGLKFADALFLIHIGPESLPKLYSFSAGCMIFIATLLIYFFHKFSPYKVFIAALSCSILFYLSVFFAFFQETQSSAVWYVFRVVGSVNFAVIGTCFWNFIDLYYHLQDAKRVFSLFNSMIFLGISGTGLIMYLGIFEFQTLSLFIALLLGLAIGLIFLIHDKLRPLYDDTHVEEEPLSFKKFFSDILHSKFTLLLVSSNLLIYLLMATTEFNYYSAFDRYFDTGRVQVGDEGDARLTQVLGQALAGVSFTNLLFGLFFYSRLLRRFGIGFLLPITPLLLIFIYGAWQLEEAVWIAFLGYFVVEGTNYVIDDANFTLLLNAVPARFKPKIRIAIESFFEPVGTLFAALLLSLGFINPKILGLVLSLGLLALAIALRRQYLKAIWHNLAENAVHFRQTVSDWFQGFTKKESSASLLNHLQIEEDAPFALECIALSEDKTLLHQCIKEADSLSLDNKVLFIRYLVDSNDPLVIELAQKWLMHAEDPLLIQELYWFLAKKGLLHPDKLNDELESPNLKLKGAAILTLLTAKGAWAHKALAVEKLGELFESEDVEAIEIGLRILALDPSPQNLDIAISYLTHASSRVRLEASKAVFMMATPLSQKAAPRITSLLLEVSETEARQYLLKALKLIGDPKQAETCIKLAAHFRPNERRLMEEVIASLGLKNVPLLFSFLKDRSLLDRSRLTAGKALGKIALVQLRAHLEQIIEPEIERAVFYWKHWQNWDFELLSDTLRSDYFSVLDFIIQLLGVAGEVEDTELLSRALRSPFPKTRSHAIETIEKTCEPQIFRRLQPLFEERIPLQPDLKIESLLLHLQNSSSIADKIVAYAYMKKLNIENWKISLKNEMINNEELFKHFAYELLE